MSELEKQPRPKDCLLKPLASKIKNWGKQLGFQEIGIANIDLHEAESHLNQWLKKGLHGNMLYMEKHGLKRSRPELLIPNTIRVITARLDYLPAQAVPPLSILEDKKKAYIARYALGRDYHKVLKQKLKKLCYCIENEIGTFDNRAFVDSAPILEKALAEKSGIGWIGKNTNLINKKDGSWFFIGEIYTNLLLPIDTPAKNHCGSCTACLDICPTKAFLSPYQLDARKCISYLTIENKDAIPLELRKQVGNRIFGCDDCQIVCPWNRFAKKSNLNDFTSRNNLDNATLLQLFDWSKSKFLKNLEGSAIRRIGHDRWLRNIAVAMGNAPADNQILHALIRFTASDNEMVKEHIQWATNEQQHKISAAQ